MYAQRRWARALWGILDQAMRPPGTGQAEQWERDWDRTHQGERECVHVLLSVSPQHFVKEPDGVYSHHSEFWRLPAATSCYLLSPIKCHFLPPPLRPSSPPPSFSLFCSSCINSRLYGGLLEFYLRPSAECLTLITVWKAKLEGLALWDTMQSNVIIPLISIRSPVKQLWIGLLSLHRFFSVISIF